MEFVLSKRAERLIFTSDGESALRLTKEHRPALVVLDVMMPSLDGFAVTEAIRADPSLSDIRIVLLTANAQAEDVARGLAAGADTYLTKPFAPDIFSKVVAAYLDGESLPDV